MKLERTVFFVVLILCIGAVVAAYRYRASVIEPKISMAAANAAIQPSEVQLGIVNTTGQVNQSLSDDASASSTEALQVLDPSTEEDSAQDATAGNPTTGNDSTSMAAQDAESSNAVDTRGDEGTTTPTQDSILTQENRRDQHFIFDDNLTNDWQDWGWDTAVNFENAAPVFHGDSSISVRYDSGWGAIWLSSFDVIKSADYDILRFWIHGGSAGSQPSRVSLADGNQMLLDTGIEIVAQANEWIQVDIPLVELNAAEGISGIIWQDALGEGQPPFYIDRISFVKLSPRVEPQTSAGQASDESTLAQNVQQPITSNVTVADSEVTVDIDAGADRRPINPDIYGINYGQDALLDVLGHTIRRWGGNATTRYNWQIDVSNRASDWFFENIPEEIDDVASLPKGSAADRYIIQNQSRNVNSIMTMPMIGWTPKSREVACGYPISKYGAQQAIDPWNPECGNGYSPNGNPIVADPSDTSTAIGAKFVSEWIDHLIHEFGRASEGGVGYYNLDNEPMLWHQTHRDVHPSPVGYDELYERTVEYARTIKQADPSAMTLGPSVWGWTAYFYSALDQDSGGLFNRNPDSAEHGNLPLLAWYLQKMQQYEAENGIRILDYLDIHYYPQAQSVALAPIGDEITQELRLRSTRSLWDETYVDESWINEPVQLIPRMRAWIDEYYPGTKLAITEYNWGALEELNGALAQAEVLGIFGREGVDLATLWDPKEAADPFAFAFRVYRNYDNAGGQFGDTSIRANTSDSERLSAYAAQRASDGALTVIVINKSDEDLATAINVVNFEQEEVVERYQYSSLDLATIRQLPDLQLSQETLVDVVPAQSLMLFVINNRTN